jgi:hypothetical protein
MDEVRDWKRQTVIDLLLACNLMHEDILLRYENTHNKDRGDTRDST